MIEKTERIDLWATKAQKKRWENMANKMYMSLFEYLRRCADAHTTILEKDTFQLVDKKEHLTEKEN